MRTDTIPARYVPALMLILDAIESSAAAASEEIARGFRQSRKTLGLRPYAVTGDRLVRLPERFECPECGGRLVVEIDEWSRRDGTPTAGGYRVMCEPDTDAELAAWGRDEDHVDGHRYWQSDWQHTINVAGKWLVRNVRVVR